MFTSPYPDVTIPSVSIYEYLCTGLSDHELDTTALIDGTSGAETSYRTLIARARTTEVAAEM